MPEPIGLASQGFGYLFVELLRQLTLSGGESFLRPRLQRSSHHGDEGQST
jgi:hypothetical protein